MSDHHCYFCCLKKHNIKQQFPISLLNLVLCLPFLLQITAATISTLPLLHTSAHQYTTQNNRGSKFISTTGFLFVFSWSASFSLVSQTIRTHTTAQTLSSSLHIVCCFAPPSIILKLLFLLMSMTNNTMHHCPGYTPFVRLVFHTVPNIGLELVVNSTWFAHVSGSWLQGDRGRTMWGQLKEEWESIGSKLLDEPLLPRVKKGRSLVSSM